MTWCKVDKWCKESQWYKANTKAKAWIMFLCLWCVITAYVLRMYVAKDMADLIITSG